MEQRKRFMKASAFDLLLVLALSLCMGYAVASGFEASLALRGQVWLMAVVSLVLLLILFSGAWSRKARATSIVGAVVFCGIAIAVALALTPQEAMPFADGSVNDVEGNLAIFVIVILATTVIVYLLSRSRAGVVVLAIVSVFTCCVVQFLFRGWMGEEGGLAVSILAMTCSLALIVYRRYCICVGKSERTEGTSFPSAFLMGVVAAAASVLLSSLVFVAVIAPMNLTTPILKPFEHRIIPPIIDYTGTYDEYLVENPDVFTSFLNEREESTRQNAEGGTVPNEEQTEAATNPIVTFLQSITLFSDEDWNEDFDPVTIDRMRLGMIIVYILIAAAIIGAIFLRIHWRKVRLDRIADLPLKDQVIYLYDFLLSRFKRLKLGKPETSTPLEFAFDSRRNLVPFTRNTGQVDFVAVTLIYQRAVYGGEEISQEDHDKVVRYYKAFFNNTHRFIGTPKWIFKFWRI